MENENHENQQLKSVLKKGYVSFQYANYSILRTVNMSFEKNQQGENPKLPLLWQASLGDSVNPRYIACYVLNSIPTDAVEGRMEIQQNPGIEALKNRISFRVYIYIYTYSNSM